MANGEHVVRRRDISRQHYMAHWTLDTLYHYTRCFSTSDRDPLTLPKQIAERGCSETVALFASKSLRHTSRRTGREGSGEQDRSDRQRLRPRRNTRPS